MREQRWAGQGNVTLLPVAIWIARQACRQFMCGSESAVQGGRDLQAEPGRQAIHHVMCLVQGICKPVSMCVARDALCKS